MGGALLGLQGQPCLLDIDAGNAETPFAVAPENAVSRLVAAAKPAAAACTCAAAVSTFAAAAA